MISSTTTVRIQSYGTNVEITNAQSNTKAYTYHIVGTINAEPLSIAERHPRALIISIFALLAVYAAVRRCFTSKENRAYPIRMLGTLKKVSSTAESAASK